MVVMGGALKCSIDRARPARYSCVNPRPSRRKAVITLTSDARHCTLGRCSMIRNFRHKGLKRLYETGSGRLLAAAVVPKIEDVLSVLDVATSLDDLHLRGLHPLQGQRRGEWAVTITANWRLVFRLVDGHVVDVGYEDYH